jgi:hypothetical protein
MGLKQLFMFKEHVGFLLMIATVISMYFFTGCNLAVSSPEQVVTTHVEATQHNNKKAFLDTLSKKKRSDIVNSAWHYSTNKGDYTAIMQSLAKKYQGQGKRTIKLVEKNNENATVLLDFGKYGHFTFELVYENGWKIETIR